uniref:Phosphatidic acid phosphatase type 2/haloperoxidase domain-containing protein n=1 Tax=Strigamia maritima TaxID=126957 RepID=T1J1X0_STRMM
MVAIGVKIGVDAVCIIIVAVPLIVYKLSATPFQRGFFCDDESIRHPYKDSTITTLVLYFVGTNTNFIMMIILEAYRAHRLKLPTRNFGRFKLPGVCWELYRVIGVFGFGCCVSHLTTDIAKYMVGRLRPHFIEVCEPDINLLKEYCDNSVGYHVYVEQNICRGDLSMIREARLSFPSGHSSFSAFTMVYLALYLQSRWTWTEFKLVKPLLQFGALMMAMACGLSRISDYKHHWSDVLAGFLQGTLVALIIVFFVSDLFKPNEPRRDSGLPLHVQPGQRRLYSTEEPNENHNKIQNPGGTDVEILGVHCEAVIMFSSAVTLGVDLLCLLIVGVPMFLSYPVTPFHRGFFCDDESIRYPSKESRINDFVLHFTGVTLNVATIIVLDAFRASRHKLSARIYFQQVYNLFIIFTFGVLTTELICSITKIMTGRLRPYFLTVCEPNATLLHNYCNDSLGYRQYIEENICTGNPSVYNYARSSFPSGHASASAFTMVHLVLYIEARWMWTRFKLIKPLLQFGALLLALACGFTRFSDYKHHWDDILAGFVLGTLLAVLLCFKCAVCGTKLTLRTYFNNQQVIEDREVYCNSHVPKIGAGHLDGQAVGIRSALNVPKTANLVNEQIRGAGKGTFDAESLGIRQYINKSTVKNDVDRSLLNLSHTNHQHENYAPKFDATALHISHALKATELHRKYNQERNLNDYLDRDTQTKLEMRHRSEEDDLYKRFAHHRAQEEKAMDVEIKEEWEKELERLTQMFEQEMKAKKRKDEKTALTIRHQRERDDLQKTMTLKRDRKRESLTRHMLEEERAATAAMVEKHSKEMLSLINEKKKEFLRMNYAYYNKDGYNDEETIPYPSLPPPPTPPAFAKSEIYNDPLVFSEFDTIAINVAQEDQKTFTDLVRMLISKCSSDVEKARTIFRWITVKNLNTMQFDENVRADTPMGLLRGIKHGTESYHVLFKRLCSYAGLHCVVIKGYSKSAGYQPGVCFEDNRFRNSWNAVYVAKAWRFVQCNWGARHLVNAKQAPRPGTKGKADSLRYEYDDHYFLTDPREFIYEFFPIQTEWQLLRQSITLREFEELPFVRSLFFRYKLYFPDAERIRAVMATDNTGATTIRIGIPAPLSSTLIFHYNLKFYSSDGDSYDNISLKRFVMQSVIGNTVAFRVHAPCSGALLLDVFANSVTPKEYLLGEPMKFKSVCKFKIDCDDLQTVMVPLPDCASGEWGPMKATRLFGLIPITHRESLIFASRQLDVQFRMSRPLTDFMATLHKNGVEEKKLGKFVSHSVVEDVVTFLVNFPEEGQYGMDIYTRDVAHDVPEMNEKHLWQLIKRVTSLPITRGIMERIIMAMCELRVRKVLIRKHRAPDDTSLHPEKHIRVKRADIGRWSFRRNCNGSASIRP